MVDGQTAVLHGFVKDAVTVALVGDEAVADFGVDAVGGDAK